MENINTLSMESKKALAMLTTLAQNQVKLLSTNVKVGNEYKNEVRRVEGERIFLL